MNRNKYLVTVRPQLFIDLKPEFRDLQPHEQNTFRKQVYSDINDFLMGKTNYCALFTSGHISIQSLQDTYRVKKIISAGIAVNR